VKEKKKCARLFANVSHGYSSSEETTIMQALPPNACLDSFPRFLCPAHQFPGRKEIVKGEVELSMPSDEYRFVPRDVCREGMVAGNRYVY
jgi:hypothetical protein